jgi:uncharacterized cupredoxin-like copper-binding protein
MDMPRREPRTGRLGRVFVAALAVAALTLVACSNREGPGGVPDAARSPTDTGGHGGHASGGEAPKGIGTPGDPASADRVVEIRMTDQLTFDPASLDVTQGETVKFIVTNEGQAPHEFVLGKQAYQEDHAKEMGGSGASLAPDTDYGVGLVPGEQGELTWTFSEAGSVLYGCHVAGHYDAGMVGTITVS